MAGTAVDVAVSLSTLAYEFAPFVLDFVYMTLPRDRAATTPITVYLLTVCFDLLVVPHRHHQNPSSVLCRLL